MSTPLLLIALLTTVKDDTYSVRVVKAPATAIEEADGDYILDQDSIEEVVQEMEVRGMKNATARLNKLADKHSATLLGDKEAMAALLGKKPTPKAAATPKAATPKATPAKAPTMPPATAKAREEKAAKDAAKAKPAKEPKAKVEKPPKAPKEPKAPAFTLPEGWEESLTGLGFTGEQAASLKNSPKSVCLLINNAIPASAVIILPNGGARVLDNKLPEGHPYLSREGAPERKPAKATTPKTPKAPKEPKTGTVKGYRLEATKAEWGEDRWYNVGTTVDKSEVERVSNDWSEAGFTTRIIELTRGTPKHTLWVTPGDPIVSLIPGDKWVGDHLGPHLKAAGVDPKVYREQYGYTGPMVALRAAASLAAAHTQVRREHMARAGGLLVEVLGDTQATIWRVDSNANDKATITAVTSSVEGVEVGSSITITLVELVNRTKPVGKWTSTDQHRAAMAVKAASKSA